MRFDAYAGSIRDYEFDHVAQAIGQGLGGMLAKGSPRRRYSTVLDVHADGRQAAWIGQDQGNGLVYFEGKGETSPDLARVVRTHFEGHTVARADVCEDYDESGAFDRLVALTREHKGPKVEGQFVRLPDDPSKGKTWQAGVRGGVAMIRVYEAGLMADRAHYGRPNWARVELECRPHYAKDKRIAAKASPLDFWGFAAWTQRVGEVLAQVPVPRFEPQAHDSCFDKRTLYLARTFRRHWQEMLSDFGAWDCIGREIEAIWAADDQAKASMAAALKRGPGQ